MKEEALTNEMMLKEYLKKSSGRARKSAPIWSPDINFAQQIL